MDYDAALSICLWLAIKNYNALVSVFFSDSGSQLASLFETNTFRNCRYADLREVHLEK